MSTSHDPLVDDSARTVAQSEFDRPVAVEAGAGTGKTTVLVARILSWCIGRGWDVATDELDDEGGDASRIDEIAARVLEGLVAITFTEAAAAQMARRVGEALNILARDADAEVVGFRVDLLSNEAQRRIAERARALIGVLDRLAIRTIHSHCFSLLSTYPMAAGLALDLKVDADGRHLDEVVHETVEEAIKRAYAGSDTEPLRRLALAGVDPRYVAEAVRTLVAEGFDASALALDPFAAPARAVICQRLNAALNGLATEVAAIGNQRRSQTDRDLVAALERTRDCIPVGSDSIDLAQLARLFDDLRNLWDDRLTARLGNWARGDFTKTASDLVGDRRVPVIRHADALVRLVRLYRRIDFEILDSARRAVGPLVEEVDRKLRQRGILTFSSLMTETWRLLDNHPEVRRRERRKTRQLLVDEFQDTDFLQCELIRLLAFGGDRKHRPGLFVVGDPKQSIYGWRDADLEAYENFLEDLRTDGGLKVELTQNFRSVPAILEEVDRAIRPVMLERPGFQPRFSGLVAQPNLAAQPGFDAAGRAPIEYWLSWTSADSKTRADDAADLEAKAIAADIRELHDREGVSWGEFGLLLRSTSRLETYLESFRRARVPFVVTSDKHYFRRREIIDATALIRAIVLPNDHTALVTLLRSPSVGIPDAALLPLWRQRFPEVATRLGSGDDTADLEALRTMLGSIADGLPDDLPGLRDIEGWHLNAFAALENLARVRRIFRQQPVDRFIEEVRRRFLLDVTESARHLGLYRLANLDRFFRQLEWALEERAGDAQAVLRALHRSVTQAEEAEQALPERAVEDAVQVMTIHGAKGLEFGHVYLPQLHAERSRADIPRVTADRRWLPGRQARYVLFGVPTPGYDEIEERIAAVETAERVRTLYVAMTRARHRLVMIGNWPRGAVSTAGDRCTNFLDLLVQRADVPQSLAALWQSCAEAETSWQDIGGARWRIPALEPRSFDGFAKQTPRSGFPPRRNLKRDEANLRRHRHDARERMARPFAAAASSEAAEYLERLEPQTVPAEARPEERRTALAAGAAFHRLLETWDLSADDPRAGLERHVAHERSRLLEATSIEIRSAAAARFEELLDHFQRGRFFERMLSIAAFDPAREVPILTTPGDSETGPVGYVSGFIDLLYRDRGSGKWFIVDYKTDRVDDEAELEERARAYALQEAVYARAVEESFSLDEPPVSQLWFVWSDRLWEDSSWR